MMKQGKTFKGSRPLACVLLALAFGSGAVVAARQDGEVERDIKRKYTEFATKRPRPGKTGASVAVARKKPVEAAEPVSSVGVTAWRLVTPETRSLTHRESPTVGGWLAERLSSATKVRPGDRLRFTIEASGEGYLYVVSREQYTDGSFGPANLIFPTTRIRNGDNRVSPGVLVGLPALEDNPPFFTLEKGRGNQVAETVSILITPEPLPNLPVGRNAVALSEEQFAQWRQYDATIEKIELKQPEVKGYTAAEHAAERALKTRKLTQGDPLPQTIYRLNSVNGRLSVTFPIPMAK
jgi:hypothetical protein